MINVRPLSTELQKTAEKELKEISSRIPADVQHIRDWLTKQPHLKARTDDQWLVTFLRGCKYSLEKTKSKLDLFYALRTLSPECFSRRYPFSTAWRAILKSSSVAIVPQNTTTPNPTMCIFRWNPCKLENCNLVELIRFWLSSVEILMNEDDNAIISGIYMIVDYSELTLNYALQFTPALMKASVVGIENAYPIRIKGVYIINAIPIFETIYTLAKSIISKKMKDRLFVYSPDSMEDFYKKLPKDVMPKEYGGKNISIEQLTDEWNKKVESYEQWFKDDMKYKTTEALRPASSKSPEDILGMDGSFRKLSVD